MRIVVIGSGYVGLVSAACFAEMGHHVICVDKNPDRVHALRNGVIPIYEPELDHLVLSNVQAGRLHFTDNLRPVLGNVDFCFIAVGTPSAMNGSADTLQVFHVAEELGQYLPQAAIVVNKSTVPVGTAEKVERIINQKLQQRGAGFHVEVVSNPEFLREGSAIDDFMHPDRILIGAESKPAKKAMQQLYAPFTRAHPRVITMGRREAEMSKYAANAMLATRISFMNEVANLCESLEVDIEAVRLGIGSDSRIGYDFLYAGCGYGGSCFPKDVRALIYMAQQQGLPSHILQAVEERNTIQKSSLYVKLRKHLGKLEGKHIAIWGLSFKPGTDDIRESPALRLMETLIQAGATVSAYDPVACANVKREVPKHWLSSGALVLEANDQYAVVEQADALVLATEWKPFCQPDLQRLQRQLRTPLIVDGRNQYDPAAVAAAGIHYYGVGRGYPDAATPAQQLVA